MKKNSWKYLLVSFICTSFVWLMYATQGNSAEIIEIDNNAGESNAVGLLEGKNIVIDPGHGGVDIGTTGLTFGTSEKEVNLTVAQNIKRELEKRTAATVVLTRDKDIDLGRNQREALQKRIQIADDVSADLYISIHHDAFTDPSVNGIAVHYSSHQNKSENLAEILQASIFKQSINAKNRGVRDSDFYVLKNNSAPAVLLELGFTSNKEDEIRMVSKEFQSKTAISIVDGIIEFFAK
ncbi:N-acetylmuramoyl-L-alanine amidase family protein [Lysinibacillus sphaericus]|uniref:N-acetylmuramoyl-L-alanine amidase family protein n=1 Tax=Lysinibacillus sphaericus TaxID=1421 RepID=UPI003F7A5325